jgi:hypothetical protein
MSPALHHLIHHECRSQGTCAPCPKARRTVCAAVAAALDGTIAHLEKNDLKAADADSAHLLEILQKLPPSTVELVGQDMAARLEAGVRRGHGQIRESATSRAIATFRAALIAWFEGSARHTA